MKSRRARIFRGTQRNLSFLAQRLRAGDLVAVPTETVYGLAGNALDPHACAKIFRAKGRPSQDPLIVHIHSWEQMSLLCEPNAVAVSLARAFWPGALTFVLPKKKAVPDIVTAGRDSVAIRMPSHRLFRQLLKLTGLPLAVPSANPFGYLSPTSAEHVQQSLGTKIRYILDGGESRIGLESTIVDLRDPRRPAILRPGVVTVEQLEKHLGQRVIVTKQSGVKAARAREKTAGQVAPGMLARHYSPRTPLTLHARLGPADQNRSQPRDAFVYLRRPSGKIPGNVFWLDAKGRLSGVARRLFATLRRLDGMKFQRIHIERAPDQDGLGPAINDRLMRAATHE